MNEIIAEALVNGKPLVVEKLPSGKYQVSLNGVVRHPNCTAEDAMRAMAFYMNGIKQPKE